MIYLIRLSLFLLLTTLSASCKPQGQKAETASSDASAGQPDSATTTVPIFRLPDIPAMLTDSEQRMEYLAHHYWDCIHPADTSLLHHQEEIEQAWADYCDLLLHLPLPSAQEAVKSFFTTREADLRVYGHFKSLAEKYLDDPNSPFRNEEIHIATLEAMIASPLLSDIDKLRPRERLKLALRNRVGTRAVNFAYARFNGAQGTLYPISTAYTLLFFNEPGCPSCASAIAALHTSSLISRLLDEHRLTLLALYVDDNVAEWQRHTADFPDNWINGYDPSQQIRNRQLYDLRATPSLYLLDKDKKVLLKDATAEQVLEWLERQETFNL